MSAGSQGISNRDVMGALARSVTDEPLPPDPSGLLGPALLPSDADEDAKFEAFMARHFPQAGR